MKPWIEALRLRTLPLSAAGVFVASGIAGWYGTFRLEVFIPMLIMVLLLQIISNFADEYGDLEHGVDNDDRLGPVRGMQRGEITREQMKRALVVTSCVTVGIAIVMLFIALGLAMWQWIIFFLLLGALCIVGAIKYTVGKGAYGYYGLGDLASFFFFGIVAVCGGFFLYSHTLVVSIWFPAIGLGSLVAAMLNLNNMRDLENDKACGKRTIAVLLGSSNARVYQIALVLVGFAGFLSLPILCGVTTPVRYLFVLLFIPLFKQLLATMQVTDASRYDAIMKPHSMSTAFLAMAFALCLGL